MDPIRLFFSESFLVETLKKQKPEANLCFCRIAEKLAD